MAMKKCKECGEEISSSAKVCPKCGKKQGGKLKIILIVLILIITIAMISGGADNKENFKKDYLQNEVVTYDNVKYSIIKVEKTQGSNEFIKPQEGNEYVKVTIRIENNSDEKITYNALDWQMVNADGVEDAFGTYTADDDKILSSGDLDAGGKIEGVLVWEQKIGDENLRLRFYDNVLVDDTHTFQFKLD